MRAEVIPTWEERLARLFLLALPRRLAPRLPLLADRLLDGAWLLARPRVAALAPALAFLAGLIAPVTVLGNSVAFTSSLVFMVSVIVVSVLSGTAGVALTAGFVLGDLLLGETITLYITWHPPPVQLLLRVGARVVPYLLLVMLGVLIPHLARRIAAPRPAQAGRGAWLQPGAYALTAGALVYAWCQATIVLIRPAYTWLNTSPEAAAITPVQLGWPWLVSATALAAGGRLIGERAVVERNPRLRDLIGLTGWWAGIRRPSLGDRLPSGWRVGLAAVAAAVLLAGTYPNALGAVVVAATVGALEAWRVGLVGARLRGPALRVRRLPLLVRIGLTATIGYAVAWWLATVLWRSDSLWATSLGALLTLAVAYLLLLPFDQPAEARA